MRTITFSDGAGPFTFDPAGAVTDADKIVVGGGSQSTGVRNDSASTQTFNVQLSSSRGFITAAAGDLVFNGLLNVGNGGAGTSGYYTETFGPHDIYIQGAGGGLVGMGNNLSTSYNVLGSFVVGATSGDLQGTVYIDTDSPISALNSGGGRWNGNAFVYNSNLRISTAYALGEGGDASGYTAIRSGASLGAVELVNNITTNEKFRLDGRSTTAPHIVNISGNNTLTGPLVSSVNGANYGLQSDDGLLTVQGDWTFTSAAASTRTLNLSGMGNGRIEGMIDYVAYPDFVVPLNKYDGGTWTLTNAYNSYNGATTITGGTLALSGSGAIASTPSIEVQSGAFFDVSGLSSTFTLGYAQTLMGSGTVTGNVQDGFGAKIAAGTLGAPGTLAFNGNLALTGSGELLFDLASVNTIDSAINDRLAIAGNLSLAGITVVTVNLLDGSLAEASYRLMDYTGTLTGDQTNFFLSPIGTGTTRQGFSIKTGNDVGGTANQVNLIVSGAPLSLTWKGGVSANAWDLVGTSNWNNNTQKFYDNDSVTFDDGGSNSPDVNITGDLNPGSITVANSAGHDYVFSGFGALLGSTGLTKSGSGKLTIANSGTNAFSGAIAVNGGTLQVGSGGMAGNLGPGTVTLDPSGTLAFDRSDDITVANDLEGSGTLEKKGAGIMALMGTTTSFSGPVTVTAGTLKVNDSLGTAATLPDVANNALLQLGGSAGVTFARRITGSGNLEKVDANTVVLLADNNYLGSTTITDGTLSVGNGGTAGGAGRDRRHYAGSGDAGIDRDLAAQPPGDHRSFAQHRRHGCDRKCRPIRHKRKSQPRRHRVQRLRVQHVQRRHLRLRRQGGAFDRHGSGRYLRQNRDLRQ